MFLLFDKTGWFNEILRGFFGGIDHLVFSLLAWIMNGIFELSDLLVNSTLVEFVYNRIYIILSLFMIFKLSFSFIKYLVSPDAMSDKEQGVGKLISKTVVMLCILVALPILFFEPLVTIENADGTTENKTVLSALQTGVVKTLPSLILGYEGAGVSGTAQGYGEDMALAILRSLYYPMECEINPNDPSCDAVTGSNNINSMQSFKDSILQDYDGDGTYDYYYMWPLTLVAGVLMVAILLGIAIDVAIRTFKLIILQMVAPIPVMMYIDPKSSKDGAFNSWIQKFISTFVDLFIKLGVVYLVILLVSQMLKSGGLFQSGNDIANITDGKTRLFVRVFLIIGLFNFAKDAPKFIKEAMGIKDDGSGGGFMGKAAAGMAGAAMGFAGGLASGGLAGGLSGAVTGFGAGTAGNAGKAFSQVRDEQAKLLGKTPGGLKGKIQNAAMQRSVMRHTGLNKDTLAAAKQDMLDKQNQAAEYAAEYQRLGYVRERDANGNIVKGGAQWGYDKVVEKQKAAAKAQSNYDAANSIAGQIGLKPTFFDENKRHGLGYDVLNRVYTATTGHNNIEDFGRNAVIDIFYGDEAGYEEVEKAREEHKAAEASYRSALRGGFGPKDGKRPLSVKDARTKRDEKRKDHFDAFDDNRRK